MWLSIRIYLNVTDWIYIIVQDLWRAIASLLLAACLVFSPSWFFDLFAMFSSQNAVIQVLAHASSTRLFLKKGREDQRIAKVVDSPTMPEADAAFR